VQKLFYLPERTRFSLRCSRGAWTCGRCAHPRTFLGPSGGAFFIAPLARAGSNLALICGGSGCGWESRRFIIWREHGSAATKVNAAVHELRALESHRGDGLGGPRPARLYESHHEARGRRGRPARGARRMSARPVISWRRHRRSRLPALALARLFEEKAPAKFYDEAGIYRCRRG